MGGHLLRACMSGSAGKESCIMASMPQEYAKSFFSSASSGLVKMMHLKEPCVGKYVDLAIWSPSQGP